MYHFTLCKSQAFPLVPLFHHVGRKEKNPKMAEAALFTVASKILSTIAGPAFEKAYERACSVWNARDDLDQLKDTILTIQAVLLVAERKQKDSAAVKVWIKRVKNVLYDADDLFDEVATDDLLRRSIKRSNKVVKKVLVSCSRLNLFVSNNDIANRVKDITKGLRLISEDMRAFNFVECGYENPISGMRKGEETGSFVDPKIIVGRDEDKEAILKMLSHDQSNDAQQGVQVIAIVGIGGMGKTTLTQLVYNHEEVERNFEKRWFSCISDSTNDSEVYGKIYQSMSQIQCGSLTLDVLHTQIKESIEGMKFLLVLDDVWDDHHDRWQNRLSMLSSGAKGSKIIVSTRSSSVARAVGAFRTHILDGLSDKDSWDLFKRVAGFTPEQEEDSTWTDLGREIVKKCRNVPLAINCIASLLFEKNTIQEWESFRSEELPQLGLSHEDGIMPVLKLSYEYLRSDLKHCFAYCSLFPKDHLFVKDELINLWIAQGYINPNKEKKVIEDVGHSYFMDLLRRSFFQEECMALGWYKMHDLIHDLAIHVAGEESLMLTASFNQISGRRHVRVGYIVDESWLLPKPLHGVNRMRSLFFLRGTDLDHSRLILGKQLANLKSLRALSLPMCGIENVPSSVGELKHLRYLDISYNEFKELPDSITNLVNLCTLDITFCDSLKAWPNNFRKFINLRHLLNGYCSSLKDLPPGFEELTSLQRLDNVRVGKGMGGGQRFKLGVLHELKLRGELSIWFECDGADDWDGVECWQPPLTLQQLRIYYYKGTRLNWGNGRTISPSLLPKLTSLSLFYCPKVKCLLPFRHIPNLKHLQLWDAKELEYIEEEEAGSDALFIPDLEKLVLQGLPKLKGWSRKVEHHSSSTCTTALPPQLLSFPNLSSLDIGGCPELISIPVCPHLRFLELDSVAENQIQQLQLLPISGTTTTSSTSLEYVSIKSFDWMESFPGESLTSLQRLEFRECIKLKRVELAPLGLSTLKYLLFEGCPEMELWEENNKGVDWDSLHKLIEIKLDGAPYSVKLPNCLLRCQEHWEPKQGWRTVYNQQGGLALEVASLPSASTSRALLEILNETGEGLSFK